MSTMPGSGRTTPVAPSGLRVLFGRVASGHRMRLALTYGLTVIENLCDVLYPFVIGLAIDGLLAGRCHYDVAGVDAAVGGVVLRRLVRVLVRRPADGATA